MTEFLPPVVLRLGADISEYITKLAEADAALEAFVHRAQSRLGDTGTFADAGAAAGKSYGDGVTDGAGDVGERVARDVSGRLRDERGRFVAEGKRAGEDVGSTFSKGFGKGFGALGSVFSASWKTFLPTAITAAVGGAAQLVSALAPAVGVVGLLPAVVLSAATALVTLKTAFKGVGDALSAGMSGDTQKFAEALKSLAPAAQATVRALVGLKPQLDAIKQTVQQNFFAGLAGDIKKLGNEYLPVLRQELGYTATGFNEVIGSIAAMAKTPGFLDSVHESLHNIMRAITNVLGVLPGFVSGFNDLVNVGSRFLPGLTKGFGELGDRFSAFMAQVADSGQLAAFIQGGLDALKLLGPLLKDVTSIIGPLFQAMGASGGQALGVLGQLVGTITDFLKSAGGMQVLTTLFQLLGQVANTVGGALGQVFTALEPLLGALVTALQPIINLLTGQFLPIIVQLVSTLAAALIPVINALAPALASVLSALMPVVSILGGALGQVLMALAPVVAQLATTLGQVLVSALMSIMPLFVKLLPVIADLAVAVMPALIPVIRILGDLLIAQSPLIALIATLLAAVLAPAIKLLVPVVNLLVPPLTWLAEKFDQLTGFITKVGGAFNKGLMAASTWRAVGKWFTDIWKDITGFFSGVGSAIAGFFTRTIPHYFGVAVAWFTSLPGKIGAALARLPGMLVGLAKTAFDRFFYIIGYGIGFAIRMFVTLPGRIWGILTSLWDGAVRLVSTGIDHVVSFFQALPGRAATFFSQLWHSSVQFVTNLVNDVVAWVSQLPGRLESYVSDMWSRAKRLFSDGVSAVVSFAQSLPGKVAAAVSGLWDAIKGAVGDLLSKGAQLGSDLLHGMTNGIKGAVQSVIDAVTSAMRSVLRGAKAALGISSPSKAFAEIGENTVAGFVQGVNANASAAAAAVNGVLNFGPPRTLAAAALASGGASGGATSGFDAVGAGTPAAPIVVQANLYIDGKLVHRALIPHAQMYRLRTGSTGLETPR